MPVIAAPLEALAVLGKSPHFSFPFVHLDYPYLVFKKKKKRAQLNSDMYAPF